MKIENNKSYIDGRGQKVDIVAIDVGDRVDPNYPILGIVNLPETRIPERYNVDGVWLVGSKDNDRNLVQEWSEPVKEEFLIGEFKGKEYWGITRWNGSKFPLTEQERIKDLISKEPAGLGRMFKVTVEEVR